MSSTRLRTAWLLAVMLSLHPIAGLACEASCFAGLSPLPTPSASNREMPSCHMGTTRAHGAARVGEPGADRNTASSEFDATTAGACRHDVPSAAAQPAPDRVDAAPAVTLATRIQASNPHGPAAPTSTWRTPPRLAPPPAGSAGTLRV